MAEKIYLGTERELRSTFTLDVDDSMIDPVNLKFTMREPDQVVTPYVYGEDLELEKLDVGVYRVLWTCRKAGAHSVRWDTGGIGANITVAGEEDFFVEFSKVLNPSNVLA